MLLTTILTLLPFAIAIPPASLKRTTISHTEQWHIPRLDMHILSATTGGPGNPPWENPPPFNSSIDFDVVMPASHATFDLSDTSMDNDTIRTRCYVQFLEKNMPSHDIKCMPLPSGREFLSFKLWPYTKAGPNIPEAAFTIGLMSRVDLIRDGHFTHATKVYSAQPVDVMAFNHNYPTVHVFCALGMPWDGFRCHLWGSNVVVDVRSSGWGLDNIVENKDRKVETNV